MKSKTVELRLSDVSITFHKEITTAGLTHCIPAEEIVKLFRAARIEADGISINITGLQPSKEYVYRLTGYVEIHEVL